MFRLSGKILSFDAAMSFPAEIGENGNEDIFYFLIRDDDEEDEVPEDIKGTANIMSFFRKPNHNTDVKPHQFFQERCLEPVSHF